MPSDKQTGGGAGERPRRPIRYKAMIKLRVERDVFLRVFQAAKYAGSNSTSDWMRRVLGDAATRELDARRKRDQFPRL